MELNEQDHLFRRNRFTVRTADLSACRRDQRAPLADKSAVRTVNRFLRKSRSWLLNLIMKHRVVVCCSVLLLLASCSQASGPPNATPSSGAAATAATSPTIAFTPSPTPTATPGTTPVHYTMRTILSGVGRPDDLVFDPQGRLVFSDFYNGTIRRVNADGSVTTILAGLPGPEGLVYLSNGALIFAEQSTNSIAELLPGSTTPVVLRRLPGTPSPGVACKDGVDGIGFDPTTNTLIIPDSPIGNVYRMSLDGKTLQLLASGIVRPVGAAVDAHGNVYVADECGGAVWVIAPGGKTARITGFSQPDDVAFDPQGNLLLIDLGVSVHALIRVRMTNGQPGQHETLWSQGFIEPQGLVVDARGNIYVSDDYADKIVEFVPA
jgi:sugar lactone lactonase YvrE